MEGGTLIMGSPRNDEGRLANEFQYKVKIDSFYMLSSAVTQELWEAIMGNNPSSDKTRSDLPVSDISWYDCLEFIKAVNKLTGKHFRLPTEEEWEYAAKGGNKSKGYIYSGSNIIDEVAWYEGNSDNRLHPVKELKPNELGLYDMSGNVSEWCEDFYYLYRKKTLVIKLKGCVNVNSRVSRGGSWNRDWFLCRPSCRPCSAPNSRSNIFGFRIVIQKLNSKNYKFWSFIPFKNCILEWKKCVSNFPKFLTKIIGKVELKIIKIKAVKQEKYFVPDKEKVEKLLDDFVFVEGGTFIMGSPDTEEDRYDYEKLHKVKVDSFYMQATVVTQELWEAAMGNNPSSGKTRNDLPVTDLNYYSCLEFIKAINELTGKHFRLPTAEEWEYAAKGGNISKGYVYSGSNIIDEVAWYWENSDNRLHPVKELKPNELGLYDMNGNIDEWCGDFRIFESDHTLSMRGGNYRCCPELCCLNPPYSRSVYASNFGSLLGFRLAHS